MGLVHHDCRGLCDWHAAGELHDGLPLFRCSGCRSEWTPAERWTPINADGEMPEGVLAAKAMPRIRRN